MNQELLDEWEEISKRYGFDKQQVYIEGLHGQNTPQNSEPIYNFPIFISYPPDP